VSNILKWTIEKDKLGRKFSKLLYKYGLIKTWYKDKPSGWTLVSGLWSPFYVQLRPLSSCKDARYLLEFAGKSIWKIIQHEAPHVTKLLGIAFSGIPIALATTMVSGIPSCYTRKIDVKISYDFQKGIYGYGEHSFVEGEINDGDVIAVIDDVVTLFDSKLEAISQLQNEIKRRQIKGTIRCDDVIVLVDREQGAREKAFQMNINLHSLVPLKSKGIDWLKDSMTDIEYEVIKKYLDNPHAFQEAQNRQELIRQAESRIRPSIGEQP
jgi:orotate phosphoribosyltransferase